MIFALDFWGGRQGTVCDQSDTTDESDNLGWVRVLDRGSIFHCRMEFIKFLCAMEVVVNGEMIRGNEAAMKAGFKEKKCIKMKMCSSGGPTCVMLPMWTVSVLKHYHYVVIQGFAFAARWMEVFKEGSKKNLCGTKSLRINCRLQLFLSVHQCIYHLYVISVIIYMSLHANISLL